MTLTGTPPRLRYYDEKLSQHEQTGGKTPTHQADLLPIARQLLPTVRVVSQRVERSRAIPTPEALLQEALQKKQTPAALAQTLGKAGFRLRVGPEAEGRPVEILDAQQQPLVRLTASERARLLVGSTLDGKGYLRDQLRRFAQGVQAKLRRVGLLAQKQPVTVAGQERAQFHTARAQAQDVLLTTLRNVQTPADLERKLGYAGLGVQWQPRQVVITYVQAGTPRPVPLLTVSRRDVDLHLRSSPELNAQQKGIAYADMIAARRRERGQAARRPSPLEPVLVQGQRVRVRELRPDAAYQTQLRAQGLTVFAVSREAGLAQIGREATRHGLRLETRQSGQQTEWRLVAPEKKGISPQVYYPHPTLEAERLRGETRRGGQATGAAELRQGRNGRAIWIDSQRRVVRYQGEAGQKQSREQAVSPESPETPTRRGRRR